MADGIQVATFSPEKSCEQQGDMSVISSDNEWQPEGAYVSSYTPSERYGWMV